MQITPEMRAEFENNRLAKQKLEHNLKKYFWASVIIGAAMFAMSFFAGAISTMDRGGNRGPNIFYAAMSAGFFQIIFGILTVVLGFLTSAKKRVPCIMLLVLYSLFAVGILVQKNGTFNAGNIIFLIAGIALNVWALHQINIDEELKTKVGYPHFVPEASFRAEYEESADVVARRAAASADMETIGGAAAPAPVSAPVPQPVSAPQIPQPAVSDPVFSSAPKPLGPTPSVRLPDAVNVSGPVSLADMTSTSGRVVFEKQPEQLPPQPAPDHSMLQSLDDAPFAVQKESALPQVNAADMLAEMTAMPSHATVQGNPDMLPSPEEVRARMAAMKRAREEHRGEM